MHSVMKFDRSDKFDLFWASKFSNDKIEHCSKIIELTDNVIFE